MAFSKKKGILFSIILLIILIAGAELSIRVVCWIIGLTPYHAIVTEWMKADKDVVYDFRHNYTGRIYEAADAHINNVGLRSEENIKRRKRKGAWRALCLGDSTTFGFTVSQGESWPAQLQGILREKFPDREIQVLNAGRPAYTSYQGRRWFEKYGLEFEPDVVLAGFGHNDRRFVLKPEQQDGPERARQLARALRWRSWSRNSYALLAIGKVMRRVGQHDTWEQDVLELPSQRLDDLTPRVDLEAYRENLAHIAEICREKGWGCVFLVMGDAPQVVEAFERGRKLREEGNLEEAIAVFKEIGEQLPEWLNRRWFKGPAYYEIGITLEKDGRTTEAEQAFDESAQAAAFWSSDGGSAIRFDEPYMEAMREVAEANNAEALEIDRMLADRPDVYTDHCHFNAEGHRLIAEAVARFLVEHKMIGPADGSAEP